MSESPLNHVIPDFGAETLQGLQIPDNVQDGQRIGGSSKRQFVRFRREKFLEPYATEVKINERTGATTVLKTAVREVEREFVHVVTPGDKIEIDSFAQDFHRRDFWHAYKAFRDGKGIPLGTPIEECQYVAPSIQLELKYRNCHTEEQLADASDLICDQIADGYSLREFARANARVRAQNQQGGAVAALMAQVEMLQSTLQAQAEQLEAVKNQGLVTPSGDPVAEVVKRGRPRKVDLEA